MKQHKLIEHYLVPTALIIFNVCLVHFIYLLAVTEFLYTLTTALLLFSMLLFAYAFYTKRKWAFLLSIGFYLFLFLTNFI
jgi:hypothetical protein